MYIIIRCFSVSLALSLPFSHSVRLCFFLLLVSPVVSAMRCGCVNSQANTMSTLCTLHTIVLMITIRKCCNVSLPFSANVWCIVRAVISIKQQEIQGGGLGRDKNKALERFALSALITRWAPRGPITRADRLARSRNCLIGTARVATWGSASVICSSLKALHLDFVNNFNFAAFSLLFIIFLWFNQRSGRTMLRSDGNATANERKKREGETKNRRTKSSLPF